MPLFQVFSRKTVTRRANIEAPDVEAALKAFADNPEIGVGETASDVSAHEAGQFSERGTVSPLAMTTDFGVS